MVCFCCTPISEPVDIDFFVFVLNDPLILTQPRTAPSKFLHNCSRKSACWRPGIFTTHLVFPPDFPNSPPVMTFETEMWHPNVYPDGKVQAVLYYQLQKRVI